MTEDQRERRNAMDRARRKANPDKRRAIEARYRKNNLEKRKASIAAWHMANPEKRRTYSARFRKNNPEKEKAYQAKWTKANPDRVNAKAANRRATKLQATPSWAHHGVINLWYALAKHQGQVVDHTVPLKGKTVCGLHCQANLQLLTAQENKRKGNSLTELASYLAI